MSDRQWRAELLHPDAGGPLGELFALVFEHAGQQWAVAPSSYGVSPRKHRVDVSALRAQPAAERVAETLQLFGLERVEVFSPYLVAATDMRWRGALPDEDAIAELCQTHPATLKLGGALLARSAGAVHDAFVAWQLAFARTELAMARRLNVSELQSILEAAISLVTERFAFSLDPKTLKRERKLLEKALPAHALTSMKTLVTAYVQQSGSGDVERYLRGVELSALRAALVACGDPSAVKECLAMKGVLHHLTKQHAERELLSFAFSEAAASLGAGKERPARQSS